MKRALAFLQLHVVPALVCFGAALALMQTSLFRRVENATVDERTKFRAQLQVTVPADEIAWIAIDETSLHDNGRWPWNREVHGDLLALTARVRPAVIAWDILFTETTPEDEYLAREIAANRSVVLGALTVDDADDGLTPERAREEGVPLQPLTQIEGDVTRIPTSPGLVAPTGKLAAVASIGFVDTPPGEDGVRRTAPLVVRVGRDVVPTLSLRTLMEYWAARPEDVTVRLGDAVYLHAPLAKRRIPIDATGAYTINYRHGQHAFVQYGYTTAWTQLAHRLVRKQPGPIPALSGRIVLVGQQADGLSDFGPTPFSPLTPLVLVHANIIENVLREDYVRPVPPWTVWLAVFAAAVAGLAWYSERKPADQVLFSAGVPVAFLSAATLVWIDGSWLVPVVGPMLGFVAVQVFMIGRRMLVEMHAKEQIKGMFGSYVSPELVNRLVAAGKPPELGGHAAEVTAYFSDIEGFSTISELLPPDRVVELMNEYLSACTDVVQAEGGTLDKYIGDAMVVIFGAPVRLDDHAYRACVAAVRAEQALERLRQKWRAEGKWPEIVTRMRTRVGLNSGVCVIGNMGSRTRFNYTMMGDNVNLAARMESGAKSWGTYAMCTDATRSACEAHAPGAVVFRPLGRIQVKGRAAAVPIFEITGLRETVDPRMRECVAVFSQALERYYARDWDAAAALFDRSAALEPLVPGNAPGVKTNPSLVYHELVAQYRIQPPTAGWDGVFVMKEK